MNPSSIESLLQRKIGYIFGNYSSEEGIKHLLTFSYQV